MEDPEHCDVYSTGTHECWHQVYCGKCHGGAKFCVARKKVVCGKCGKGFVAFCGVASRYN